MTRRRHRRRFQNSVRFLHCQAPCLAESCPQNGDPPKSPLLTIGSLVPSVGTKSISKIELVRITETAGPLFGQFFERPLHEATRVYLYVRRCSGNRSLAAHRTCAAARAGAADRRAFGKRPGRSRRTVLDGSVCTWTSNVWLDRRSQRPHRLSMGCGRPSRRRHRTASPGTGCHPRH